MGEEEEKVDAKQEVKKTVKKVSPLEEVLYSLYGDEFIKLNKFSKWFYENLEHDFYFPFIDNVEYELNQYDYEYQQIVVKLIIRYSKLVSSGKEKPDSYISDKVKEIENPVWHDIYKILVPIFSNKSIANFIKENK